MGFFAVILLLFVGLSLVTVGLGFLFALTADETGFVALLPLLAVFALLLVGTIFLARRAMRS